MKNEPARLLTPKDFENNPDIDRWGYLPAYWVLPEDTKGGFWESWSLDYFEDPDYADIQPWNHRPTKEQIAEVRHEKKQSK